MKQIMILIEISNTRSQLCDILTYVATTDMDKAEFRIVYTAIVEKMRAI